VKRFLTFLMILTLVAGQGSSAAWAACRHKDARDHAAALQSPDRKIAAVAQTEEAAASVESKKGAASGIASMSGPQEILPPVTPAVLLRISEPVRRLFIDDPALNGTVLRPLLQPPSA
jgi:hypothetical protein